MWRPLVSTALSWETLRTTRLPAPPAYDRGSGQKVPDHLQQSVFVPDQLLPLLCLLGVANTDPSIDPGSGNSSSKIAWRDSCLGIVANALHLACISFRVNIKQRLAGRLCKPYRGSHAHTAFAECLEAQIFRLRELTNCIRHNANYPLAKRRWSRFALLG